jgi:hypothetical protein
MTNQTEPTPNANAQLQGALADLKTDFIQKITQLENLLQPSTQTGESAEESEFSAGYIAFASVQEDRTVAEIEEIVNKIAADYGVSISKLNPKWGAYELTFNERIYASILISFVYALSANHLYVVRLF